MKAATSDIKKELQSLEKKEVLELCLRLARYKKENKELLAYLLFDAHDVQSYVQGIKEEIDEGFETLPKSGRYLIKKGLRKILRLIAKYTKYIGAKEQAAELLLHFCENMKAQIPVSKYDAFHNLYLMQIKKIADLVDDVHEDLQYDYRKQLEAL